MAEVEKNWKFLSEWKGKKPQGYPDWLLNLLYARGLKTKEGIESFLSPKYEELSSPSAFKGMKEAVERIAQAKEKNQRILVYGDYDVDGICATAIMVEALNKIGVQNVESYIPHREEEGYGLNKEALLEIVPKTDLIITVDCGITSKELVQEFSNHADFIICDHHEISEEKLPQKAIILHPKLVKKGPKQEFSAAGMAFYFVRGLQEKFNKEFLLGQEKWLLDLVGLSTICDVVPLVGENRTLAKWGLLVLSKTKRAGLLELMRITGIEKEKVSSYHAGFVLGPRLNAAGRLSHAKKRLKTSFNKRPKRSQGDCRRT